VLREPGNSFINRYLNGNTIQLSPRNQKLTESLYKGLDISTGDDTKDLLAWLNDSKKSVWDKDDVFQYSVDSIRLQL
jgi:hypothetical protein